MFKETIEVASTGLSIYELVNKSRPSLQRIVKRLRGGEVKIVVFGAGGTGKTTLGKMLSGESDPSILADYKESRTTEKFNFKQQSGIIIIPPGQGRRDDEWFDSFRQVSDGKFRIIINVVSYGYHSLREISYISDKLYQQGMTVEEFVEIYTEKCRQKEINQLKEISTPIKMSKAVPTLMLTLVSKQDIWWQDRDVVTEYYSGSEYDGTIQEILSTRGTANFSHKYVSASLIINGFTSGIGESLKSIATDYSQPLQFTNLVDVFKIIDEFCQ
jgi:GTPase SAR1 family protein